MPLIGTRAGKQESERAIGETRPQPVSDLDTIPFFAIRSKAFSCSKPNKHWAKEVLLESLLLGRKRVSHWATWRKEKERKLKRDHSSLPLEWTRKGKKKILTFSFWEFLCPSPDQWSKKAKEKKVLGTVCTALSHSLFLSFSYFSLPFHGHCECA